MLTQNSSVPCDSFYSLAPDAWASSDEWDRWFEYEADDLDSYGGFNYQALLFLCQAKLAGLCKSQTRRGRLSRVQLSERMRYLKLLEYIKYRAYRECNNGDANCGYLVY